MPETPETATTRSLLPGVFNAFPVAMRKLGDGQVLLDTLADVLPAIERQVRAKVSKEILTGRGPDVWNMPDSTGWVDNRDRDHAARIARGEQP